MTAYLCCCISHELLGGLPPNSRNCDDPSDVIGADLWNTHQAFVDGAQTAVLEVAQCLAENQVSKDPLPIGSFQLHSPTQLLYLYKRDAAKINGLCNPSSPSPFHSNMKELQIEYLSGVEFHFKLFKVKPFSRFCFFQVVVGLSGLESKRMESSVFIEKEYCRYFVG